jgi:hypothetical protein
MSLIHRLFSTPVVPDDDAGKTVQSIVMLVTQAGLDPLMRSALQMPLLPIAPIAVETPLGESYTLVSMLFFIMWFVSKSKLSSCWSIFFLFRVHWCLNSSF